MKMKQKILNNMVYIAVVAVLITTTLIGMFTYYRYMESDKDSDGYVTQEILGKDLSSTVEKLEVKQFLRIGLTKEDSYGTYSYYLNGKEVSAEILDCRESDSIKVIFKVKDGLKIKRGINFFASSSTGTKTFNKGGLINLNNRSITFEDLGITVEKKE